MVGWRSLGIISPLTHSSNKWLTEPRPRSADDDDDDASLAFQMFQRTASVAWNWTWINFVHLNELLITFPLPYKGTLPSTYTNHQHRNFLKFPGEPKSFVWKLFCVLCELWSEKLKLSSTLLLFCSGHDQRGCLIPTHIIRDYSATHHGI